MNTTTITTGQELAQQGMELTLNYLPNQEWKHHAICWILSRRWKTTFTADDLVSAIGMPASVNAVGAVINQMARCGEIVFTGRVQKSLRPSRHVGIQRIWEKT